MSRWGVALFGLALLAAAGCSTTREVPVDTLVAAPTGRATVVTDENFTYNFERVEARGDSLIGTYYITEERISSSGAVAYVDVARHTVLPLSRIQSVQIKQLDYGNTLLLGAGATLFAIWATSLDDERDIDSNRPSSKENPSIPIE